MSKIMMSIEFNYTTIPNHIILNNKIGSLSKSIYCYIIMRLNQNQDWDFFDNDIMNHLKEGRDAFRRAKKELINAGYLTKLVQNKRFDGTFAGCEYAIHPLPITENPYTDKPTTDKPTTDNQSSYKEEKLIKNITNKEYKEQPSLSSSKEIYSQDFIDFFNLYEKPQKQTGKTARKDTLYKKYKLALKENTVEEIMQYAKDYLLHLEYANWKQKKDLIAWLNNGFYQQDWKSMCQEEQKKQGYKNTQTSSLYSKSNITIDFNDEINF